MIILILSSFLLTFLNFHRRFQKDYPQSFRRSIVASFILVFIFIAVITEALSSLTAITPFFMAAAWLFFNIILLSWYYKFRSTSNKEVWQNLVREIRSKFTFLKSLGIPTQLTLLFILSSTFIVALVAPPNNLDSLSYHISRIGYWVQNSNIEHYATHIERSISFSPFSEYVHLNTYLLAGSERYFQLLQWCCFLGILLFVTLFVEMFSKSLSALRLAVCFAATIPILVLESMTTQNDLVAAFFIIATAFYVFDYLNTPKSSTLLLLCASVSLGIMTKGTFVFYTFPFGIYLLTNLLQKRSFKNLTVLAASVVFLTLLLNGPFWYRTYKVFNSPIGTFGNGNQNNSHSPASILSSTSKHLFLHLGFISPGDVYNQSAEKTLVQFHKLINIPLNTSGMGMPFKMNKLNFNEDYAHNFLAVWLILFCFLFAVFQRQTTNVNHYLVLTVFAFLTFCTFISYQTYGSRLHIPFFVLMAPVVGVQLSSLGKLIEKPLIAVLSINAIPFALLSITHPLLSTKWFFNEVFPVVNKHIGLNIDPEKLLNLRQESILFNSNEKIVWGDQWPEIAALVAYVDVTDPKKIGFDFNESSLDYGFQYVLRKPGRTFEHIAVKNPSHILKKQGFYPDAIIAENNRGEHFTYDNIQYFKKWSGSNRWVYIPEITQAVYSLDKSSTLH